MRSGTFCARGYFNVEVFKQNLQYLAFYNPECSNDANKTWLIWKGNFMEIIDSYAAVKKRRIHNVRAPWINKSLLIRKWQQNNVKRKACKAHILMIGKIMKFYIIL